jgi:hypothetical protein
MIDENKFFHPAALLAIEKELCAQKKVKKEKVKKKGVPNGYLRIQLTATYVEANSSREASSLEPEGMSRAAMAQLKSEMAVNKLKLLIKDSEDKPPIQSIKIDSLVSNGKTQACNFEKIHPRLNSQE